MSLFGIDILLIEDNEADAEYVSLTLRRRQPPGQSIRYRIEHATTMKAANQYLPAGGVDLVLLDLSLPDTTGLDTFNLVAKVARSPVGIITGTEDLQLALESVKMGAYFYLLKDWLVQSPAILHFSIISAIEQYRQAGQIQTLNRERLKELRPLILACPSCHKWRDPANNDWMLSEDYIEKYTDINFSHGICPDCAKEHYGDILPGEEKS